MRYITMENVMTNGFCELNENEMMMIDGGWDGWQWLTGVGQTVAGIGVTAVGAAWFLTSCDNTVMSQGIALTQEGQYNIETSFYN